MQQTPIYGTSKGIIPLFGQAVMDVAVDNEGPA